MHRGIDKRKVYAVWTKDDVEKGEVRDQEGGESWLSAIVDNGHDAQNNFVVQTADPGM